MAQADERRVEEQGNRPNRGEEGEQHKEHGVSCEEPDRGQPPAREETEHRRERDCQNRTQRHARVDQSCRRRRPLREESHEGDVEPERRQDRKEGRTRDQDCRSTEGRVVREEPRSHDPEHEAEDGGHGLRQDQVHSVSQDRGRETSPESQLAPGLLRGRNPRA